MTSDMAVEFARHFERKHILTTAPALAASGTDVQPEHSLRKLWEQSELLRSVNSPTKYPASMTFRASAWRSSPDAQHPLTRQFSRRFLREMIVFPYRSADGRNVVAIADPSDAAAI